MSSEASLKASEKYIYQSPKTDLYLTFLI